MLMGLDDITPHIEAARQAAERARTHAQAALIELETERTDAATGQLAAEKAQRIAEAAQLAAEAARDAAESAQVGAEAATREAELAQHNLQAFLAMAAHDIRGPLTAIAGYTDLLAFPTTPPEDRDIALTAIQAAVIQMERLIADIVDAGRLGAGAFRLRPEPLDLVSLVQRVANGQQTTSDRHRILVETPRRLDGVWDPDRLGQVMTNLIANAIKYSPGGGDVTINVHQEQESAVVRVADQGRGMCAADLPLLFRPFTRLLPPAEQAQVNGTGLGLYISHGIVQAHGGRIWATSQGGTPAANFAWVYR
jgi:signal transduction histidine kinase